MKTKRALKNMDIAEVSLVDRPANKRKFLLIKREDGEITELTIKSDGTTDGTTLSVNGVGVSDLKAFWFALWPSDEFDDGMVSGSYTVSETDGAEFDRETTFNLKKGMNTMKKITLESLLKSLNIDATSLSAERTAEVESLLKFVNIMPPENAAGALNIIKASLVKEENPAQGAEGEEAPGESDDMAQEKVAEILSAMAQLNAMLPEDQRVVIKSEEPGELQLILAAIEKLGKLDKVADKPVAGGGSDDPPESEKEILQSLIKRLNKVEKNTGVSEEVGEDEVVDDDQVVPLTPEQNLKKYGTKYPKAAANFGLGLIQS